MAEQEGTFMQNSEIMVSVICNVYNHEKYIREALDSFVMQKTDFSYEVLVHDDASTDHSADIIREYEKRYPQIIKPIYQSVNQYSKCNITLTYQIPRVKGNYIAICEGDDYWSDAYKLQKQFEEMENHPEIDMCAHAADVICDGNIIAKIAASEIKEILDTNRVILGGGEFFATNSLFLRTEMFKNIPDFYKFYGLDYVIQIWGSLRGGILFLPDYMSTYRTGVINSWSDRTNKDVSFNVEQKEKLITVLRMIDSYTDQQYHTALTQRIAYYGVESLLLQHRYYDLRHGEYRQYYNAYPIERKMRILARQILHVVGLK